MSIKLNKALFLDRDGIINLDKGYLYRSEDVVWVDGIFELCRVAKAKGYLIVIVTNQSGIGRGYYSEQDFHLLMLWMKAQFKREACEFDGVYFCPHHPERAIGEYKKACCCRKPEPGMILSAQKELLINLEQSLFIGDKLSDMQAAEDSGIPTKLLLATKPSENDNGSHISITNLIHAMPYLT